MNDRQHIEQITRLLDNSPAHPSANPVQRFAGFKAAVEDYPLHIVRAAVDGYIKAQWQPLPDGRYPIHAPLLAFECRRLQAIELEDRDRTAGAIAQIEARDERFHEDPPELRRMTVQEQLARCVVVKPPEETPEQVAQRREQVAEYLTKHDAAFVDMRPESVKARLFKART